MLMPPGAGPISCPYPYPFPPYPNSVLLMLARVQKDRFIPPTGDSKAIPSTPVLSEATHNANNCFISLHNHVPHLARLASSRVGSSPAPQQHMGRSRRFRHSLDLRSRDPERRQHPSPLYQ